MRELSPRFLAFLQLVRLPNWFTAVADVMAGYLIVTGFDMQAVVMLKLMAISATAYGAGCVLNDICDQDVDSRERPFRPLPSGRVSEKEARRLLFLLIMIALSMGFCMGGMPLFVAGCLLVSILAYDLVTKNEPLWGPFNMALCRGLNLLLGMSPRLSASGLAFILPFLTMAYVFSLTLLSRHEVESQQHFQGGTACLGWAGVVGVLFCVISAGYLLPESLLFAVTLVLATGLPLGAAVLRPDPQRVGRAVRYLVLSIPILDAVYVAGIQGWGFGVPVALCIVPAFLLSRHIYVT